MFWKKKKKIEEPIELILYTAKDAKECSEKVNQEQREIAKKQQEWAEAEKLKNWKRDYNNIVENIQILSSLGHNWTYCWDLNDYHEKVKQELQIAGYKIINNNRIEWY